MLAMMLVNDNRVDDDHTMMIYLTMVMMMMVFNIFYDSYCGYKTITTTTTPPTTKTTTTNITHSFHIDPLRTLLGMRIHSDQLGHNM